jgi:hypothetical protein
MAKGVHDIVDSRDILFLSENRRYQSFPGYLPRVCLELVDVLLLLLVIMIVDVLVNQSYLFTSSDANQEIWFQLPEQLQQEFSEL